ncbi:hypothetical protein ABZ942_32215 [Nocardia sp. NPDC046473]|uniref:hypothetical protein n=1 Tax=Nocardia sp. NPDC046473 TaxID=3155733 RepID=UPI0033F1B600
MLRSHRFAAAAMATVGAMAAALVLTAPAAPAAITAFTVKSLDDPATYTADCAYIVRATAEPGTYLSFHDGQDGKFDPPNATKTGVDGDVLAMWTPHTTGLHTLHAVQAGGDERTIEIEVGTGAVEECAQLSWMSVAPK